MPTTSIQTHVNIIGSSYALVTRLIPPAGRMKAQTASYFIATCARQLGPRHPRTDVTGHTIDASPKR